MRSQGVSVIREFLYVDVSRVRSLLAQLDRGVVESVIQAKSQSKAFELGAVLYGLHAGGGNNGRSGGAGEQRSLEDLLFAIFEEVVESKGILRDADDSLQVAENWTSSLVGKSLLEGEILRLSAPMMIVDSNFVRERFAQFSALNDAMARLAAAQAERALAALGEMLYAQLEEDLLSASGGRGAEGAQRRRGEEKVKAAIKQAEKAARSEQTQPMTADLLAVFNAVNGFLEADALSLSILPCGEDHPELRFSGSLMGREDYIQGERQGLFARYGSVLQGWTAVVQIAAVPGEPATTAAGGLGTPRSDLVSEDGVDRVAVEQLRMRFLGSMEAMGIAEGPIWPRISVIPLGIYRVVPRSTAAPKLWM
jgi:hypothetical protein